jgi:DNA-binding CsgD family transcriptional regulator
MAATGDYNWSDREREVLELIVLGCTNGAIADRLGISFATAKWHVSELISKLGVSSREEVAAYWKHQRSLRRRMLRLFGAPALVVKVGAAAAGAATAGIGITMAIAVLRPIGVDDPPVQTSPPHLAALAAAASPSPETEPPGCRTIAGSRALQV